MRCIMTLNKPPFRYAKILFFAALLLPLCSAAVIDDTALRYLAPGEKSSATITNFSSGGVTYYMVFQNQTELFVLKPEGQNYTLVSDKAALTVPLKDYIAFKYGASVSPEKITSIRSEYAWLSNFSKNCTTPMRELMLNSPLMTLIMNNDGTGNTYKTVMRLTGQNGSKGISIPGISNVEMLQNKSQINKYIIKGYVAVIVGGMNYLGEIAGNLSENASTADNTAVVSQMKAFVAEYKTPLTQYVADHNFMNTNYPPVIKKCDFGSSSFAKMDALLVVKVLPSEADLADNLSRSAAARITMAADSGSISALVASEQAGSALLAESAAAARQVLTQYGMPTTDLDSKLAGVNASLERTKNSVTAAEAETLHADFQAKLAVANNFTGLFRLESTVSALAAVEAALNGSQWAIGLAASRMGGNDTNVNNLNQTWETVRLDVAKAKADLAQGKPGAVTAISNSTTQLTTVKATAEGLNQITAQMDVLIIGFVVLIIIIGIVAFFYTRNRRKEPPVVIAEAPGTPGLKKASSGIIIERK